MNLTPEWLLDRRLFVMTTPKGKEYVTRTKSPLNSDLSISLVKNKHHARLVLQYNGMQNIPFAAPKTIDEAAQFIREHSEVVVKPKRGMGSEDIHIVTSVAQLDGLRLPRYIFEKYMPGIEMRYLVLNNEVIAVHESRYGTSVSSERDLRRISYAKDAWDAELTSVALRVANIFGLRLAAVDFMIDESGAAYILEVNTMPGLAWLHFPTSGPAVDVATLILQATLDNY